MKQTFFLRLLVVILLAGVLLPFLISDRLGLTVLEPFLQRLNHHYVATSAKTMGYWLSLQEESQLQEEFASISELYPVPMALFQSHNMALTPEQRRSLKAGNTLYLSIPSSQQDIEQDVEVEVEVEVEVGAVQKYFIHQIPGSDYLFSFASPDRELVNVTTYATAEALGTLALLQKYFQSAPQAQWPEMIEQLAPLFPHPLYLQPLADLNSEQTLTDWALSQRQHKELNDGQVVTITEERALMNYGTGLNYFMQRLNDSQWVVVGGPVAPKIRQQIDRYMLISQGFLAALVIVLLFIWLLPTWHASRSLMISAKAFSMGNRSSRARGYKLSHFRPVTDTFNQMAEDIESDFRANQQLIQTLSQNMSPCISEIEASLNQLEVQINNSEKTPLARGVESLSEQEVIDLIEKNTEQLTLLTSNALVEARLASGASENLSSGLFKANTNGNRL